MNVRAKTHKLIYERNIHKMRMNLEKKSKNAHIDRDKREKKKTEI